MSFHVPPSLSSTHVLLGGITLLAFWLLKQRRTSKESLPCPPGPRPLPLIGNILDMPQSRFGITFSKYGKEYGPLTWLTIPGQNILVVNSLEVTKELFEKRAAIYADRPRFTMAGELLGMSKFLSFCAYGDWWNKQRSHFKHALSGGVVRTDYSPLLEAKAQEYVARCAARPETALSEANRIAAEITIKLTYGKLEDKRGRDYIKISGRIADIMTYASQGYVVDLFPALQHLPKWLPGMGFKRDAARWKEEIQEGVGAVFELVKDNALSDDPEVASSFMYKKMQELREKHEEEKDVQQQAEDELALAFSGFAIYLGGLETTESTVESFIRAMIIFPSVQEKVHEEMDRVIGSGRFPTFKDEPDLPYLRAAYLENLRWHPVVSFGEFDCVPHAARQDDIYEGYFIPKGTTVIANAWAISRDTKHYPNPSMFEPERYIKKSPELDPREFIFGYGRRICPGKDLAFQNTWTLIASIIWAFKLVGVDDEPVPSAEEDLFTFGIVSHPTPFKYRFVPRHEGLKDKLGSATV